jgi:hypothetical protein
MKPWSLVSGYAELLDSIRSYYSAREGDDSNAAFSATMLLTALASVNLACLSVCIDLIVNRELRVAHWVRAHRPIALLVPVGIGCAHFWFAKWSGVYDRRGSRPDATSMPRELWWYLGATVLCLAATLLAVRLVHA